MRSALLVLALAIGCGGRKQPAAAPASVEWVAREFGDGRVRYHVPSDWNCQAANDGHVLCTGDDHYDVAKLSAGVPEASPAEVYEKVKATTPPGGDVIRSKINGHPAIEVRTGDGAVVVLLFSDDNQYFFMLGWLLRAPSTPKCREVLRSVQFRG